MGFSTVAAQIMFFIAVVGVSAGIIAVFGTYIDQTRGAMSDKQANVISQLRTDIAITNIDNTSGNFFVFVKNIGRQGLATDCLELYVDSGWVNITANVVVNPTTETQVTEWVPQQTVKLKPTSAVLNSRSVHEAKFVTCNGIWDTKTF